MLVEITVKAKKIFRKENGFTLVELMVVIVVIAILSVIFIEAWDDYKKKLAEQQGQTETVVEVVEVVEVKEVEVPLKPGVFAVRDPHCYKVGSEDQTTVCEFKVNNVDPTTAMTTKFVQFLAPGEEFVETEEPSPTHEE